jgi:hypothetical protein
MNALLRTCPRCGALFAPSRSQRSRLARGSVRTAHCSRSCALAGARAARRADRAHPAGYGLRACASCDEPFAARAANHVCCSPACGNVVRQRRAYRARRARGWRRVRNRWVADG